MTRSGPVFMKLLSLKECGPPNVEKVVVQAQKALESCELSILASPAVHT